MRNETEDQKVKKFLGEFKSEDCLAISMVLDLLEEAGFVIRSKEYDAYNMLNAPAATPVVPAVHPNVKNPVKIFYLRLDGRNQVATVYTKVVDGNLHVGVAFCSNKDRFCKKRGRALAFDRCASQPTVTTFCGHSADDLIRVWEFIPKPQAWANTYLKADPDFGILVFNGKSAFVVKE